VHAVEPDARAGLFEEFDRVAVGVVLVGVLALGLGRPVLGCRDQFPDQTEPPVVVTQVRADRDLTEVARLDVVDRDEGLDRAVLGDGVVVFRPEAGAFGLEVLPELGDRRVQILRRVGAVDADVVPVGIVDNGVVVRVRVRLRRRGRHEVRDVLVRDGHEGVVRSGKSRVVVGILARVERRPLLGHHHLAAVDRRRLVVGPVGVVLRPVDLQVEGTGDEPVVRELLLVGEERHRSRTAQRGCAPDCRHRSEELPPAEVEVESVIVA